MALRKIGHEAASLTPQVPFTVRIKRLTVKEGRFGPYLGATGYVGTSKVWFATNRRAGFQEGGIYELVAEEVERKTDITFLKKVRRADEPTPTRNAEGPIAACAAIKGWFDKAATELQKPRVKLGKIGGFKVKLYRAGERSRYEGDVQVVEDVPWGQDSEYFGRISDEGFHRSRSCTDEIAAELVAFAQDPSKGAIRAAKRIGHCCFCTTQLTDARSLYAGYGPICAGHYGLPWGEVGVEETTNHEED